MARPDIKLFNISLAFLTLGIACDNKPSINTAGQVPNDVQAVRTVIPESALMSERRARGVLLENLDFSKFTGKKLEKGSRYDVGKISISLFSKNYEAIFNPQQLLSITKKCDIENVEGNIYLEISERVFAPDGKGQLKETDGRVSSNGSQVTILMGIESAYQNAGQELDRNFEVDPQKRPQATQNLTLILFNKSLVTNICSAAILNRLDPRATRQQAETEAQKAYLISNPYQGRLLNTQDLPIMRIMPKPKNSSRT